MDGDTIFMNKQYDSSNQEKHYTNDIVNGEKKTVGDEPGANEELQSNLSEQIIKNIAVEKELSEIASAYNLHRCDSDLKTEDLSMDVDPPTDFKQECAFDSYNSAVSDRLSETSAVDSQDATSVVPQETDNSESTESLPDKPKALVENNHNADIASQDGDDSNHAVEDSSKDTEETSHSVENSEGTEENSKNVEHTHKTDIAQSTNDVDEKSKSIEDGTKEIEESSKVVEDSSQNVEERSKGLVEPVAVSKDTLVESVADSKDTQEDSQDVETENEGKRASEEEEEDVVLSKRKAVKMEIIKVENESEGEDDEEENFQEGMCGICKEDLDTNNHTLLNKHLSDTHVEADGDDIKCGVCQKEYSERRGVVRHLLNAHLFYRPNKCDVCPKAFARRDHLIRHQKLHEPSFSCKFCAQEFTSQDKLDKHVNRLHRVILKRGKHESDDDVIDLSDDEESKSSSPSDSDSDAFSRGRKRKSPRTRRAAASKRPRRAPPPPPKIETKRKTKNSSKSAVKVDVKMIQVKKGKVVEVKKEKVSKQEREREEKKRRKDEEDRQKELLKRRRQKEKMLEEERALERLQEREKARKERQEREEAKEKFMKEELQKKLEETLMKQKELDEHYFDGNFIDPAPASLTEANNMLDDYSINYTNFYGGNFHEPPKKTLAQMEMEKTLLAGYEALQGVHFLTEANAVVSAKAKADHIKMINPHAPHGICGLCGEEYEDSDPQALSKHIYEKHIDNATSDKKCAICGKEYSERKGLNRHMLHYHLNYKPHRCPYCPKTFSRRDHLTRHLAQHSDDKNRYICEFCQKSFTRKEHLNRHLWVHKDTFCYTCQCCSKAFTREENYKRHVRDAHYDQNATALETISSLVVKIEPC